MRPGTSRTMHMLARGLLSVALLSGCERIERRSEPLPDLGLTLLDGGSLPTSAMRGRPWVINLWLPG